MLKIPKAIRIGGIDYRITSVQDLNNGEKVLCGKVTYHDSTIEINSTHAAQSQGVTLWHEILHAIATHASLEMGENEEKIIDSFAYGIYQVLQDNARKLFDFDGS